MVLSGDETLIDWLKRRASPELLRVIEDVRQEVRRQFRDPVRYLVNQARLRTAAELAERTHTRSGRRTEPRRIGAWLERVSVHPLWSLPLLAAVLFLAYLFVGVWGAGTLVDLLEGSVFGRWVNPAATSLADRWIPWDLLRDLLVGPYGVVSMALTYAFALILPIVGTFFIAFG